MFDAETVRRVVDLQKRSYALLQWVQHALQAGTLDFSVAHGTMSASDAAREWIGRHFASLPAGLPQMTRARTHTSVAVPADPLEAPLPVARDAIRFPYGLPGFEGCRSFVLMESDALGWRKADADIFHLTRIAPGVREIADLTIIPAHTGFNPGDVMPCD